MKKTNKAGRMLLSLCAAAAVLIFLNLALYPCTFMRNDVHTVSTEQRDVLIMGTSCGKMGIDPDVLLEGTGKNGHNLCGGGQYPVDSYYLGKLTVEKQNPDTILYIVDPGYMMLEKEVGNNYLVFLHEFPLSAAKLEYAAELLKKGDFRSTFFPFDAPSRITSFVRDTAACTSFLVKVHGYSRKSRSQMTVPRTTAQPIKAARRAPDLGFF